ncbi:MAG: DUF192 domain-containing protein [Pseudomonadota bacterium]
MRAPFHALFAVLALFLPVAALAAPPALPVETITIDTKTGPHNFSMEVAADDESREKGLMYRTAMAPDAGMLFDFHTPQLVSFWMENTVLPLDMLFVRSNGTIARIKANATPYSRENIPSGEPIQLVIELNAGRAAALGITEGAKVHAPELAKKPN